MRLRLWRVIIRRHDTAVARFMPKSRVRHTGNHMRSTRRKLRDHDFNRVPIEENPGHSGKGLPNQRKIQNVPGIKLDEEMSFISQSRLAQGANQPAQPGNAALIRRFVATQG